MADSSKRCKNCGDRMQNFRKLTDGEYDYVLAQVGRAEAGNYRRCDNGRCRRVQHYFRFGEGFTLPDSFR
ncbi:hypothetical protein AB0I22_18420 [Streptomyces sp. NPDC050610]|uniref:hypothetical protein n=1 Tax=Streptomyces sp. NPDC050610 TaxID=3157097 RepID=UPI0034150114